MSVRAPFSSAADAQNLRKRVVGGRLIGVERNGATKCGGGAGPVAFGFQHDAKRVRGVGEARLEGQSGAQRGGGTIELALTPVNDGHRVMDFGPRFDGKRAGQFFEGFPEPIGASENESQVVARQRVAWIQGQRVTEGLDCLGHILF